MVSNLRMTPYFGKRSCVRFIRLASSCGPGWLEIVLNTVAYAFFSNWMYYFCIIHRNYEVELPGYFSKPWFVTTCAKNHELKNDSLSQKFKIMFLACYSWTEKTVGDYIFPCLRPEALNMTPNRRFCHKIAEKARDMKIAHLQRARSSGWVQCLWELANGLRFIYHV